MRSQSPASPAGGAPTQSVKQGRAWHGSVPYLTIRRANCFIGRNKEKPTEVTFQSSSLFCKRTFIFTKRK
ncbi:unnamed protein product [Oikopleura dioica]|uniref:Uncharacterized protein n=1 Tax=Oikopleura dioica TaxID=34765 RepID=E4Z184_OIKDI|nr:unnamed protein product [Oikopleura dioica]